MKAKLNIKEMKVDTLLKSRAKYNPRKITSEQKAGLESSIDKFGYVENLIYNKQTKTLVSGHQRLSSLVEKGYTDVDVHIVDIDLEQEKALNVAMNARTITGDFTTGINEILSEIMTTDVEFYDLANLNSLHIYDNEEDVLQEEEEKQQIEMNEMILLPYEHYDAFLVVCKNTDDFMYLSSALGLEEKKIISSPMVQKKKLGRTRAVEASKLLDVFNKDKDNEYDL